MTKSGYQRIKVEVYDSGRVSGKHGTQHVRPAPNQPFPQSLDIECNSAIADENPVGTQFWMDVKLKYREGQGEHLYSYWNWKPEKISN
ncbi:hypothetical protein [uncultured Algimonas sp.]|uniref:hypothetical protein n=1 Tax=uncultured Algimonas sp. TaxID=1547920 RepID=UPI0026274615|nr:hypothetical protein [uncultured Algimonas sp.]